MSMLLTPEKLYLFRAVSFYLKEFEKVKDPKKASSNTIKKISAIINTKSKDYYEKKKEIFKVIKLLEILLTKAEKAYFKTKKEKLNLAETLDEMKTTYSEAAILLKEKYKIDIKKAGNSYGKILGSLAGIINYTCYITLKPLLGCLLVRKDTLQPGPGFVALTKKINYNSIMKHEYKVYEYLKKIYSR